MCTVQYVQGKRYIVTTALGVKNFVKGRHGLYTAEFDECAEADSDSDESSIASLMSDDSSEDTECEAHINLDDMPDLIDDDSNDEEEGLKLSINTLNERRALFNAKQLHAADKAWKFVKNANVGQADAVEMVMRTPDIAGCDITRESIQNAFAINVADVAAVKGKTRRLNPSNAELASGRDHFTRCFPMSCLSDCYPF